MCSTNGERLASLTRAIDDLSAEGLRGLPPEAWAERVAGIWALVEGVDPEMARRRAWSPADRDVTAMLRRRRSRTYGTGDEPGVGPAPLAQRHQPGEHPGADGEPQGDQAVAVGQPRRQEEDRHLDHPGDRQVPHVARPDQDPVEDEHHSRDRLEQGDHDQRRQQQ